MPECSVIIPVFNQAALTQRCLEAVVGRSGCEVVVVDDASTDATAERLDRWGDRITVVRHAANQGFATSCNDGARAARGRHLVFLNNDTLPEPGWLDALLRHAAGNPGAAVIGAKLLYPTRTIQHAGVVICQDGYPRHVYSGFPEQHPATCRSRRFQVVTGACMLVRRPVFEGLGGFDAGYRNGFEDVDLCLRAGAAGHEVHYCAESVVVHLESVSPGRFRNDRDNVARYRARWQERVRPDDLACYVADGLLQLAYEGCFPLRLTVSPMLATLASDRRADDLERRLSELARQVTDLTRDNTRLRIALGASAPESPEWAYQGLRGNLRDLVGRMVPAGATVLVVSKGDGLLLELPGCQAWHFPRTPDGAYAGHHPADSHDAISRLEDLRTLGADHLLIPATARWWLDHYPEFHQHLREAHEVVADVPEVGVIVALGRRRPSGPTA